MRLNKLKQTYLIGGFAVVLLAVLSWFFLVSPRMAQAGEIGERTAVAEMQNAKSVAQIASLTKLKNGLVEERKVANALAVKFPPNADQPTLLRQIMAAAEKSGIPEKSITTLGLAAPIMGGPSTGAKLPPAASSDAAASSDGKPDAAKAAAPVENMATMTISFNAQVTYTQVISMLKNMEDLPRSFLITQVNLAASEGKFTITVQGNMYVHRAIPDPEAKVPTPVATPTVGAKL